MNKELGELTPDYSLRALRESDLETVVRHRLNMFVDAGRGSAESLAPMAAAFRDWLAPRLAQAYYYGWLVEHAGETVAGLGMMTVEWPPHPLHLEAARGYVLDVYVKPEHRSRGLASRLTERAISEARSRGLHLIFLHATEQGRPIYAAAGFRPTSEMQLLLPD